MEISIRPAETRHLPAMEELERQCFSTPWTRDMLEKHINYSSAVFLTAENEAGKALGYAGMTYILDEGYICNVAVSPDCRRQGIADRLIDALVRKSHELELAFLTLEVRSGNVPAIALYEKHGFIAVGKRKNYYDSPKEDALLMTLFLRAETSC